MSAIFNQGIVPPSQYDVTFRDGVPPADILAMSFSLQIAHPLGKFS